MNLLMSPSNVNLVVEDCVISCSRLVEEVAGSADLSGILLQRGRKGLNSLSCNSRNITFNFLGIMSAEGPATACVLSWADNSSSIAFLSAS